MKDSVIELTLSQMSEQDIASLRLAINEAFVEYEGFTGKPYQRFESNEKLVESLADEDNHFLIVKRAGEFIGGVCFRTPSADTDTLYFGTLWVAPNYRSEGIAQRLIQMVEEEAKRSHKKGVLIKLYQIPKLIKFYHGLGFAHINSNQTGPMVKYFNEHKS